MKIIDQTPLQDEKGEIGIVQRIQGTLKFGLNWYPEMEAQKAVIAKLDRVLGKGFTLVRNKALGASGIVVPLALVGPPGIYVIHVTHLRGTYQAKGDAWGTLSGKSFQPASINLLTRTERLARALKAFIERQGVNLPTPIEPILIAADPGMHVDSVRPLVRVVMSDAMERWANTLLQARPALSVEYAHELADRIVNPRPPKPKEEIHDIPTDPPQSAYQGYYGEEDESDVSRAQAIFRASEEAQPFDVNDLSFAFEEDDEGMEVPVSIETSPARPVPARTGGQKRYFGMTVPQLALLGGMLLVEICVVVSFAAIIFLNS